MDKGNLIIDQHSYSETLCENRPWYPVYLLYHDTVDAHVSVSPGEVEQVDPAESQTQHKEPQALHPPTAVQHRGGQEDRLQKTTYKVNLNSSFITHSEK